MPADVVGVGVGDEVVLADRAVGSDPARRDDRAECAIGAIEIGERTAMFHDREMTAGQLEALDAARGNASAPRSPRR